jgi:hypothetical protein
VTVYQESSLRGIALDISKAPCKDPEYMIAGDLDNSCLRVYIHFYLLGEIYSLLSFGMKLIFLFG